MIPKLNSQDLNQIYEDAQKNLNEINKRFDIAKDDLNKKLTIIEYENQYINYMTESIHNGSYIKNSNMSAFYKYARKRFDKYGNVVHSELVKEPINVFNLNISGLGEKFFREDVSVYIDNKTAPVYTSILKDESIQNKAIYFELRETPDLTLKVQLNDYSNLLGPTRCNCIEIDPFLQGSFDIKQIRIYGFDANGTIAEEDTAKIILPNPNINNLDDAIKSVGKTRFILDEKINFYKIEFDIHINYETERNSSKVYPFGIKHLYFYDMDFKTDSYITVEINKQNNISYVKDDITIISADNRVNSTITNEGIQLFLNNTDGELSYQIEPVTKDNLVEIPIDTKTVYIKIPLKTYSCMKGIVFDVIERNI